MKLTIEDKIYIENNLDNENDILNHFGFMNYKDEKFFSSIKNILM